MAKDRKKSPKSASGHRFGGDWTETKLEVLGQYLAGYTRALKNTPFELVYVDTFAGTGYRTLLVDDAQAELTFPDNAEPSAQKFLDGSARIALKTEPPFHRYLFVEKSRARCAELEALKVEFPDRAAGISVHNREANAFIQALCRRSWSGRRAVMFLDPYGMQVDWATIEAVAKTQAIDLWILFPLGIGVNRLLMKAGEKMPDSWVRRLDLLLGTHDWVKCFYREEATPTLFGNDEKSLVKNVDFEGIGRFFNDRLKTVFAGVADNPRALFNSAGCPIYLFCFAVGNPKGRDIALRIARHILDRVT